MCSDWTWVHKLNHTDTSNYMYYIINSNSRGFVWKYRVLLDNYSRFRAPLNTVTEVRYSREMVGFVKESSKKIIIVIMIIVLVYCCACILFEIYQLIRAFTETCADVKTSNICIKRGDKIYMYRFILSAPKLPIARHVRRSWKLLQELFFSTWRARPLY